MNHSNNVSVLHRMGGRVFLCIALLMLVPLSLKGQEGSLIDELNALAAGAPAQQTDEPVVFEATFKMDSRSSRSGTLIVTADIGEGWHLYSVTQPQGGPLRTKINVNDSKAFSLKGKFRSYNSPHVIKDHPDFKVNVEEHTGRTTWSAPIELNSNTDAGKLEIPIVFNGQACAAGPNGQLGQCVLIEPDDVVATFDGYQPAAGEFQAEGSHVKLSGRVYNAANTNGPIAAGDKLKLEITARPSDGFHLYALALSLPPKAIVNPTLIAMTKQNGWKVSAPTANQKVDTTKPVAKQYHTGAVTWTYEIEIPKSASGSTSISGAMGYQACTSKSCDFPTSVNFRISIPIGDAKKSGPFEMGFEASDASLNEISEAALRMKQLSDEAHGADKSDKAGVTGSTKR